MAKRPVPGPAKRPQARVEADNRPAKKPMVKSTEAAGSGRWKFVLAVLAITFCCFLPTFKYDFVNWDDEPNITENPNLERIGYEPFGGIVKDIFSIDKGAVIGNYNPLPILTFAVEKKIAGDYDPHLIHFDNVMLHLATVFFAMCVLWAMGMGNWGAFVGGLLFGIHPMRVESVAWATERKDVLFGLFFFAALLTYFKYLKANDSSRKTGLYVLTFVLALLSCFSKVQGVTLVLSMLVVDYFVARRFDAKMVLEKIPFFILAGVFGWININTLAAQGSFDDQITEFTWISRIFIGTSSFCVYLYKLFIPYPMLPQYPYPKPLPLIMKFGPVGFLAAIGLFAWLVARKNRIAVFGTAFFFVNVMFLLQWKGAGQGFLADRFTYVPYFGFFAIAAYFYDKYQQNPQYQTGLRVALGLVAIIFSAWTVKQVGIWQNGGTLWTAVMEYDQNEKLKKNTLPYWNRGQYNRNKLGNYDAALKDYSQAITIETTNPELYISRGKTYFDMAMSGKYKGQESGLVQKAIEDYTSALAIEKIKPKSKAEAFINRGAAMGAINNLPAAIENLTEGLKLDPKNKNGYYNRSIVYYSQQDYNNALADYQKYLEFDPYNANIWYESGMILRAMNRNDEAIQALTKAIKLQPKLGIAYLERARAYTQIGNTAAAQQDYQTAQQYGQRPNEVDQKLIRK